MQSYLVAIVDDDPGVRGSLHSLLRSAGMEGVGFGSAEALLACEDPGALVCILTDLHMEGMSGLDLQVEMRRRHWAQPVIMMTAYPTATARRRALEEGAHAFLTKPVDPDCLLEAIDAAIG
ncbi:response regulator [Pseudooceanicola sp. CBS1P-1]|uniref:Response regulator n=1 Tax=Pseudooceanicola albus TaxID=2692189 RepID=A0A6L7G877_9RHOB|nr:MULTISPECIES: response regulator [Pseudooceanicola]MBT9386039.1 response regulator [Pseudooceanicola endophyticus]MXN19540.1 response regulator [Pseudooceanicola albus]